jgi:hypothetical protein
VDGLESGARNRIPEAHQTGESALRVLRANANFRGTIEIPMPDANDLRVRSMWRER